MAESTKAQNPFTRKSLTQERLMEILNYDPVTGIFRWRVQRGVWRPGSRAGTRVWRKNRCYRRIMIEGVSFLEHRLAWLYMKGYFVPEVDHWDADGENNKFPNLRECTSTQNKANQRRSVANKSGFKGVYWVAGRQKWYASIQVNGRTRHLGAFDEKEEAARAYARAAVAAFGEFARFE